MAHSSFIDCEVGSSLTETFISETHVKVEIEAQQVNDDENVAVEVLGQLGGNCEVVNVDMSPLISIKTEDTGYAYVHDVQVENCEVVSDVGNTVVVNANQLISGTDVGDNDVKNICIDNGIVSDENEAASLVTENGNIDCSNIIFDNVKNNFGLCCTVCGVGNFNSEIDLQNHVFLNHNSVSNGENSCVIDTRPYKCDFCHMAFQRKSSLKNHSKIHTYGAMTNDLYEDTDDEKLKVVEDHVPVAKRKKKRNSRKSVAANDAVQDRIPPFETLKQSNAPDGCAGNYPPLNGAQDNNIFDEWNLNETSYSNLNNHQNEANVEDQNCAFIGSNKDKPYMCPFCNRSFAREKALMNHIRIHNDNYDLTLECQKCHDVFDDIISLQAHIVVCVLPESAAIEQDPLPEPPSQSPQYVPYEHKRYNFNNNTNENLATGEHICDICNKRFKTRQKVFRHMWVHRKKIYTCEICGSPFPGIKYLDDHRLTMHPSKAPFTCVTCGKSFMSKQGLTEHSRLHKGWSDQYYCGFCQKYFSSRQGFTIHGRIHTGERPYGCKYCPKSFRDGGTLKKHERIHTGERPHECPLCHKRYNQKVVLREHIRGVHVMKRNSEIEGECPICSITNMDKEEMSEHIVRHSDELMKKVKQEFLTKQKSVEKNDNRTSVAVNRKRRNRILKKVNSGDSRMAETRIESNDKEIDSDNSHVYSLKPQPPTRGKRKIGRRRIYDKRNAPIKINQKKKLDRFESKKSKKSVKVSTSKKLQQQAYRMKNASNNVAEAIIDNSTIESENFLDSGCSENSNDRLDYDEDKCLDDFTEDLGPLKLLECEMCHARFETRSELITHVLVHI